jgi:GntR family transcriptional regulator
MSETSTPSAPAPAPRPLYVQVRELMIGRMVQGVWKPGAVLPSEVQLAAELGVSQGTVRKALDFLAQDHVVVRRQGLGTFVSEHTSAAVLFRFFQFRDNRGRRVVPASRTIRTRYAKATKTEARRLELAVGAAVIRHVRVRAHEGQPFIFETLVLPAAVFPGLGRDGDLPNTLYDRFQKEFGITVDHAEEQIGTRAANAQAARMLGIKVGTPLLKIDRRTVALSGMVIEWRVSLCHMAGLHYAVRVG